MPPFLPVIEANEAGPVSSVSMTGKHTFRSKQEKEVNHYGTTVYHLESDGGGRR